MEIRVLRYFIEIARNGNMTRAAEALHVTQPTLSKQMKELEQELGKKLFRRGSTSISLTDEGLLLRKRAEDILDMVDKTAAEFRNLDAITGGDIYIGCAESHLVDHLARFICDFKGDYPLLRYHLSSGNTEQVVEQLDRGLLDLALIAETPDISRYNYIEIPEPDTWGVLMRADCPLAEKEVITVDDLFGYQLICSKQALKTDIPRWCGEKADKLNISGTYNLFFNGTRFVRAGLEVMLMFDRLADTSPDSGLCFRPLSPRLETKMYIIWRKYQAFTPIAERFMDGLKTYFDRQGFRERG